MSELVHGAGARSGPPPGASGWFVWMVGMWVAFFWVLLAGGLDEVWRAIAQLPVLLEVLAWIVFLPWVLGTFVWTSPWPEWLRAALVLLFAVCWIAVSVPRPRRRSAA
jgi:hypothetical protein